ncbi:MAG: hypothetical protein M1827_006104 [Pycnora praestabilis]|nr:MAG: hypothetical protein M1827_006104 [Pycnora praestabilis]
MSAARRGQPLKIDLPDAAAQALPPITAAFLIYFDVKAGYTIAWKRSSPGVELEGVVEFKSLPSGLHNVEKDLIYFVHDQYAGISAFVNEPASETDRNALLLAVGILVPLSYGRLGRCWRHAQGLKDLARLLAQDTTKTRPLEEFWAAHRLPDDSSPLGIESPVDSPSSLRFQPAAQQDGLGKQGHGPGRSASDPAAPMPQGQTLSSYHPALSLPDFLNTFGPLVFPLYRAGLLRKRILLVGQAPVQEACNFVYDISILTNMPLSVADFLCCDTPPRRLRPLFTVGVHDIPLLEEEAQAASQLPYAPTTFTSDGARIDGVGEGWVACTTDGVLSSKVKLYDVVVTLPSSNAKDAKEKIWPKIEMSRGNEMRATQRDLRRYRALRRGLRYQMGQVWKNDEEHNEDNDQTTLLPQNTNECFDDASSTSDEKLVEPLSWPALAYSSFIWWASAGEKYADLAEETERDASLLHDMHSIESNAPMRPRSRRASNTSPTFPGTAAPEMTIIAYFHRLTTLIISTLADIVDSTYADEAVDGEADGEEDEEEPEEEPVLVGSEDMTRMGLDVWSQADRVFVEEMVGLYFGRKAVVEGGRVECCGIRVR